MKRRWGGKGSPPPSQGENELQETKREVPDITERKRKRKKENVFYKLWKTNLGKQTEKIANDRNKDYSKERKI